MPVLNDHTRSQGPFGEANGNVLYISDSSDNRVRRIQLSSNGMASREVTTLAGGGTEAKVEMAGVTGKGDEPMTGRLASERRNGNSKKARDLTLGLAGHVNGGAERALFRR
jgi:hypothetical protein